MNKNPNDSDLVPAASASVNLTDLSTEMAKSPSLPGKTDINDVKTVAAATLSADALNISGTKMNEANSVMKQHAKDMRKASDQLDSQLIRRVRVLPAYIGQYAIEKIINQNDGRFLVEGRPLPERLKSDADKDAIETEWLLLSNAPLADEDPSGLTEYGEIDTVRIKQLFTQFDWTSQFQDMSFILPEDAGFDKGWIYISLGKKSTWDNRTPLSRQRLKHKVPRSKGIATAKMLLEICYILAELHERGVAHGHIHPGRIWKNKLNGNWEISGMGLGDSDAVEAFQVNNPWAFIAPEWRRDVRKLHPGGIPTPQADVYSIGAICMWLLTDESPLSPKKSWEKCLIEAFPRVLARTIWQCFEHKPHRRPAGMNTLIYELERFLLRAEYRSTPARESKCLEVEEDVSKLGKLSHRNSDPVISYGVVALSLVAVGLSFTNQPEAAVFLACTALFNWVFHHSLCVLRRSSIFLEKIYRTLYATLPVSGHISGLLLLVAMSNIFLMASYVTGQLLVKQAVMPTVMTAFFIALAVNLIEHLFLFRRKVKKRELVAEQLLSRLHELIQRGLPVRMAFNLLAWTTRRAQIPKQETKDQSKKKDDQSQAQGKTVKDNWEQIFETLKGYQAKIKARSYFGFYFKKREAQERPRYMAWRDWILGNDAPVEVAVDPKIRQQNWVNRANERQVALTESIHDWIVDESITMGDMFMVHPIHQDEEESELMAEVKGSDSEKIQANEKNPKEEAQVMTLDPEETTEELNFAFDKTSPLDSKLGTKTMYFSSLNEAENPKRSKVEHIARAAKILLASDMPGLSFPLRDAKSAQSSAARENIWHFDEEDCKLHIHETVKEGRVSLIITFQIAMILLIPTTLWLNSTSSDVMRTFFKIENQFINHMLQGLSPAIAAFAMILSSCFLSRQIMLIGASACCLLIGAFLNPLGYGVMISTLISIVLVVLPILTLKGDPIAMERR